MNGYCLGCRAEMPLVLVGYALSGKGVVLGAYACPAGHRVSRTLPLDPPPDDLEGRRTYAMGAAAGYAAGVAREGGKLARAFRALHSLGAPPGELRIMLGASRRTVRRMLSGEHPGPGTGSYAAAADHLAALDRPPENTLG